MIDHKNKLFTMQDIVTESFRKRPGMYIGNVTLDVYIYQHIYTSSVTLYNIGYEDSHYLSTYHFSEFVKDTFGFGSSTAGWHKMTVAYSLGFDARMDNWSWENLSERELKMSDEEHESTINLFYNLFDEFYALSPR